MNKNNLLDLQLATDCSDLPDRDQIKLWVELVLSDQQRSGEIVVRLVDEDESSGLNQTYRHKQGPTNVLSFPFEAPAEIQTTLLGDLVICAPVVHREAKEQGKLLEHHWAHIVIHGVLHLLGYDHIDDNDAAVMEALEIKLLNKLKIPNPYHEDLIDD